MYIVYVALAVLAATAQVYSQVIPPCASGLAPIYAPNCGCGIPAPAVVAAAPAVVAAPAPVLAATPTVMTTNSVAANLADTLSLLTVTSLLAETLPYSCPGAGYSAVAYPGCGCGYGSGYFL